MTGIEASSIVFHPQYNAICAKFKVNDDLGGLNVLYDIVEGFLGNPVKSDLNVWR